MSTLRPTVAAIDWGGTWIRAALVGDGVLLHRERIRRPATVDEQYQVIADMVTLCQSRVGVAPQALGIGIAGVVERGLVVTAANLGITTPTDVTTAVRDIAGLPTVVINDVQSTALALAAGWPDDLTAVIAMGTGVGGAVIDRGRLLVGSGGAGDFGHVVIETDGPLCTCGGRGCLEQLASGRIFAAAATEFAAAAASPFWRDLEPGRALHAGDLQDAAASGDAAAAAVIEHGAAAFAAAVRTAVAALDPARILLAGAILAPDTVFGIALRRGWDALRPAWCTTELLHVPDDEDAALLGAGLAARHHLGD